VEALETAEAGVDQEVERRAMLFQLVEQLPDDQKLVIMRRFVEQKSMREIAHELGRSEGAVKQLQFRALQSLRSKALPAVGPQVGNDTEGDQDMKIKVEEQS